MKHPRANAFYEYKNYQYWNCGMNMQIVRLTDEEGGPALFHPPNHESFKCANRFYELPIVFFHNLKGEPILDTVPVREVPLRGKK